MQVKNLMIAAALVMLASACERRVPHATCVMTYQAMQTSLRAANNARSPTHKTSSKFVRLQV
jgi:hypothetical protein